MTLPFAPTRGAGGRRSVKPRRRVTLLVRARDFRNIRAMQAAEKMDWVAVDDDLAGEVAWGALRVKVPLAAIYEGV